MIHWSCVFGAFISSVIVARIAFWYGFQRGHEEGQWKAHEEFRR